jgi:hypothetical protein
MNERGEINPLVCLVCMVLLLGGCALGNLAGNLLAAAGVAFRAWLASLGIGG